MTEKTERRGRPAEGIAEPKEKWELTCYEVPSKPELGTQTTFYFDKNKSSNGAYKVEITYPKDYKHEKVIPHFWLPKWCGNVVDPSARTLTHYESQQQENKNL